MKSEKLNFEYIDFLRLLACFAVILLHYSGSYTYRFGIPTFDEGVQIFTLTRWCAPIFLMISGALLLNRNFEIIEFYKKRLLRILPPVIFWGAIYISYKLFKETIDSSQVLKMIFISGPEFHFWYIYLIIGIILFLPFIVDWTAKKNKKSIIIFLLIWLYVVISTNNKQIASSFTLINFSGYLGYLVLGYFLHIISPKKWHVYIGVLLCIVGFIYSYHLTITTSYEIGKYTQGYQRYLSWNVASMSIGVFLIFKQIRLPSKIQKIVAEISKYTFGIYLAHIIVRDNFVGNYFNFLNIETYSFLFLKSLLVLILCYVIVKIISKIPIIGKYIAG
ncbi:MAG: surface polysaccharide O-acyltransferase-like enzyme [Sphingobacteriales bacterium]|jgi:surface polysaccharide O-acyltransferase-like enzyme